MRFLVAILLLLLAAPALAQQGQGMSKAMVVSSCGGGTAMSGAVTNLTMDTTGRLCQSGAGSNVCPQAAAYLARTTGGNEGGNAVNITALICGLVTDGVIDGTLTGAAGCGTKLDALYVLAQQNLADAKLNLCGTGYTLPTTTASFTIYKGYSSFPDPGMNTGFIPSGGGVNWVINSASLGAWLYDVPDSKIPIGTIVTGSLILPNYSDGNFYCGVNNSNTGVFVSAPNMAGFYICDRPSSSVVSEYFDNTKLGDISNPSVVVDTHSVYIGSLEASGWNTAKTISEAHFGASLGATLNLALYNRLRTYMTAIGVP